MFLTYGLNSYISKLATAQNLSIEILIELYMASAKRQPDDIFDWIKWIAEAGFAGQATGAQKINPFKEHMGHGMVPEKIMAEIKAVIWWIFRAYRLAALVLGTIILLSGANVLYLYLSNQLPPP